MEASQQHLLHQQHTQSEFKHDAPLTHKQDMSEIKQPAQQAKGEESQIGRITRAKGRQQKDVTLDSTAQKPIVSEKQDPLPQKVAGSPHEEPPRVVFHDEPYEPLSKERLGRATSGDPVPSQLELPGAIGESAAEGWEAIKDRGARQVAKAQELWSIWKGEDARQSGDDSFNEIEPKHAEDEQHTTKRRGFEEHTQIKSRPVQHEKPRKHEEPGEQAPLRTRKPRFQPEKPTHEGVEEETVSHRLRRYRNTLIDVWEGNQPYVKERLHRALAVIQSRKMEVPLLALATLLVLWASVAFVGWMAFPGTPLHEQVGFRPSQNVPQPTVLEQMQAKYHGVHDTLNDKLNEGIDTIKHKSADKLHHLEDTVRDRFAHLKEGAADTLGLGSDEARRLWEHSLRTGEPFMPDETNAPPHWHTQPGTAFQEPLEHHRWQASPPDEVNSPPHAHTHTHHHHHPLKHMPGHAPIEPIPVLYMHEGHAHIRRPDPVGVELRQ